MAGEIGDGHSAVVYEAENGHLVWLDPDEEKIRDLTAEAVDLDRKRRVDKAREDAEKYVNAIILDFIGKSVQGAATVLTGGGVVTFRLIAKEVITDIVKPFVEEKFDEATDGAYSKIKGRGRFRDLDTIIGQEDGLGESRDIFIQRKRAFERGEYEGEPDDVKDPKKGVIVEDGTKTKRRRQNALQQEARRKRR